ncbi:MAG TPA: hypothetical protein VF006_25590 [Longimicrobium sp.]
MNHPADTWTFTTQQLVHSWSDAYQVMSGVTCCRSLDGKTLQWCGGTGWIGFVSNATVLDVRAEKWNPDDKNSRIEIASAVDVATATSTDPRLLLALTPLGLQSLDREASEPQESSVIDLPPEVVESLRAIAQKQAG